MKSYSFLFAVYVAFNLVSPCYSGLMGWLFGDSSQVMFDYDCARNDLPGEVNPERMDQAVSDSCVKGFGAEVVSGRNSCKVSRSHSSPHRSLTVQTFLPFSAGTSFVRPWHSTCGMPRASFQQAMRVQSSAAKTKTIGKWISPQPCQSLFTN